MEKLFKSRFIYVYILITIISVTSVYYLYKKYNVNRPISAKLVLSFYHDQESV